MDRALSAGTFRSAPGSASSRNVKLGIGTVQFGMPYGISNAAGQVPEHEVARILEAARRVGVDLLDTAHAYGTSEDVLGRHLSKSDVFRIVTKTPPFRVPRLDTGHVVKAKADFLASLARLRRDKVYALLVHDCSDILVPGGDLLFDQVLALKGQGLADKVGVSVYSSSQIDAILARYPIDIIQLPVNVLDQRLLHSGHLARLRTAGVEIHARSVYLQGLLLMNPADLSRAFEGVREHLARYHAAIAKAGMTPVEAALGYVAGLPEIASVIVGVVSAQQLEQAALVIARAKLIPEDFRQFAWNDETTIDPSRWASVLTQGGTPPEAR